MATVGGSFEEVSFNHPTLGTGYFRPKAAEDSPINLGGYTSNDDENGVDGGGNLIVQLTQKRWSLEVVVANDMNSAKDLELAQALAEHPEDANWTFSHVNGTVYAGKGRPVGDLNASAQSATFTLKVAGGGKLKQI